MRKWGFVITAVYAAIVIILLVPGFMELSGIKSAKDLYKEFWITWIWISIMVCGQAALLFLRVDTSMKRLRPRQHVWVSIATIALLAGILFYAAAWSLLAGVVGDAVFDKPYSMFSNSNHGMFLTWLGLWFIWGVIFFLYTRNVPQRLDRAVGWLIKGSVLELLIAIPCHVIVRHRNDCSAPAATGFGIATGIAIMLLSFGPSVLLLYQKRMKQYEKNSPEEMT